MTGTEQRDDDCGVLERGRGEVIVRFTRLLAHPPEKVWRALTEAEHLAAWFPTTIDGDMVPGGPLRFGFRNTELPDFDGKMLAIDPPTLLEFVWGDERLRFELTPEAAGTLLRFSASFAEIGRAARDAAGWHTCFDLLGYDLDGETARWQQDDRWRSVHRVYVARFGPEAATSVRRPSGKRPTVRPTTTRPDMTRRTGPPNGCNTRPAGRYCGPPAWLCGYPAISWRRCRASASRPAPVPRAHLHHASRRASATGRAAAGC